MKISISTTARERLAVAVLLACLCYFTHFLYAGSAGLYEDDFGFISPAFNQSSADLVHTLVVDLTTWPQGRPLSWAASSAFAFLGYHLGGLYFLHVLGFLILTTNAFLCYLVLRSRLPAPYAAIAAVVFCAYPADTSQLFVVNYFFVHLAMTAFLAAILAYSRGRLVICYVLAAAIFLSWEMVLMPFFAAPLVHGGRGTSLWKRLRNHTAVLTGMVLAALVCRHYLGDTRVDELNGHVLSTIARVAASLWIGPVTVFRLFLVRSIDVAQHLDLGLLAVLAASAAAVAICWRILPPEIEEHGSDAFHLRTRFISFPGQLELAKPLAQIISTCAVGLLFLVLGYGLVFRDPYFPPTWQYGRFSNVHFAGSFGAAMLAGALSWLVVFVAQSYGRRTIAAAPLVLYLGSLVAFHTMVQREFAQAWKIERHFWTAVVRACPDLQDGTVIFHEQQYNYITYALANAWSDAIILQQTLSFPSAWRTTPRLFSVSLDWKDQVKPDGAGLKWLVPAGNWAPHWEPLDPANLIVLRQTGPGEVQRTRGSVRIAGKDYQLKQPGPAVTPFARKPLFQYLSK
jgi:hypothetical protein